MERKKRISKHMISLSFILLSFLIVIIIGACLLFCPFSQQGEGLSFIDSFFLATSAVCVTGLSPVADVSSVLSIPGRIILAILIEIGGLGFVTIIMFIAVILGFKISFGQRVLIKEALNQDNMGGVVSLLKKIVVTAISIQLLGVILNFIDFYFIHDFDLVSSIGYAFFHAVSSFNNAGFDLFGSTSLMMFHDDYLLILSTSLMIILGGIGFIVIFDIFQKRRFKRLSLHSKIVLIMTTVLLVFGTILYKALDWNQITWLDAFFMSVTTRTAGFYSIDMPHQLSDASIILTMALMFIGASPASTGGGIKVTTLFTILISFKMYATGDKDPQCFKRTINRSSIMKAFILFTFAFSWTIFSSFLLEMIENNSQISMSYILFESFSAFGTVGLTLGITPSLHALSKIIICLTMFFGRLGPITFISLFNQKEIQKNKDSIRYIEESIIIG